MQLAYLAYVEDGSWIMTVNYHKFNQVVTPNTAVVPNVVSMPGQINNLLVLDT